MLMEEKKQKLIEEITEEAIQNDMKYFG